MPKINHDNLPVQIRTVGQRRTPAQGLYIEKS